MQAIGTHHNDPELANLRSYQVPLLDMEITGVPALKFIGDMPWRQNLQSFWGKIFS